MSLSYRLRQLLPLLLVLLASGAHGQSFVGQQFYGVSGSLSNLNITYTVRNAGDLLLLFAANNSPISVSDANNAWTIVQSANSSYTVLYAATAKAAGQFQAVIQYPAGSTWTDVVLAEYAAKLDQSVGNFFTTSSTATVSAGLANPNNELVAEFGNVYGKWTDYTSTSGQTIRGNSGAQRGVFLADGTGQSGIVPANQWGAGIIAVSLVPIPIASPPETITLNVQATMTWDDGHPATGGVSVFQSSGPSTTYTLDPTGFGSGTFTVDLSKTSLLPTPIGNLQVLTVTLKLVDLNGADIKGAAITLWLIPAEVKIVTGAAFNIVLTHDPKSGDTLIKSFQQKPV
jgi:hypothetical protein